MEDELNHAADLIIKLPGIKPERWPKTHQRSGVLKILELMVESGASWLADDPGTGKVLRP